ncbi:MAG: NAD(+) diphosphatase [Bacteroidota bacterium]|nr:NAD(+) diphosphatase [Bacteroidota bacterium]
MNFMASIKDPEKKDEPSWWFVFRKDELLIKQEDEEISLPQLKDLSEIGIKPLRVQYLGVLDEKNCYSAEISADADESLEGMSFRGLRSLLGVIDDELFGLAGRAFQVMDWDRSHQYCGRCGTRTETKEGERAKVCPNCGLVSYPRLSPAIIVAVVKNGKILLAHSGRFKTKLYSVLAGFVETGETFEECVQREVKEEVNIEVKNIRYFGSQPWPFPNSVMIGFTAEYAGGEIKVDGQEILEADWFGIDKLPEMLPGKWSIARKLIDWFIQSQNKKN